MILGAMPELNRDKLRKDFGETVNMTAPELKQWLGTADRRRVGFKRGGGESVGHASGRRIVTLLGKSKEDLTDGDLVHMRKVVGFVRRHRAQEPANMVTSRWRYSLMNWGHDPLKGSH